MDDYHETFPTPAAAYAICCAKCHETKHPRFFRRQLTRAQAAARGYTGVRKQNTLPRHLQGLRVMTVESKYCTKCQPGHYKPDDMSIPEMYKAAYDGKVSLHRVNIDADRKRKKASADKSAAVSARWSKWKAAPWEHIRARLAEDLKVTTRRISYFTTRGAGKPGQDTLVAALLALQETMTVLRARCTLNARTQAKVEPETTWEDMTGTPTMRRLQSLWSEVPLDVLTRMNTSPLLLNRAQPLVLEGYVSLNRDSTDRLDAVKR